MTLRTRRRISPRTKRRYRAIRNFFRKTLGSIASQPDIKINSSIAVNVTDLKHKLVGIENQLDEVSKQCYDIVSFENISRKEIESLIPIEGNENSWIIQKESCSDKNAAKKDTEALYKTSENHYIKAENRDSINYFHNEPSNINHRYPSDNTMNHDKYYANHFVHKTKSKKTRRDIYDDHFEVFHGNLRKNRTQPDLEIPILYDSYPSLTLRGGGSQAVPAPSRHRRGRRQVCSEEYAKCPVQEEIRVKSLKEKVKRNKSESTTKLPDNRREKTKKRIINPINDELDQDFIADLIQRQYKPVKIFDTRYDSSEISYPICRDNEFSKPGDIAIGSDMCSCCVPGRCVARRRRGRSPADGRCRRNPRPERSRPRNQCADAYNDSNLYDVVPVKEKASPKSRRKFVEDNMHYEHFEVPPSPRSHRPQLNLQAQNHDESDGTPRVRSKQSRRNRSPYQKRKPECVDSFRSEVSSDESTRIKSTGIKPILTKNAEIQEDMGTISSLQYPEIEFDKTNTTLNDTLNKTDSNNDKTDKTLSEIKDILQNFLQEIKQEASTSHCDKSSDVVGKTDGKCSEDIQQNSEKNTPSVLQNSAQNEFAGNGLGLCGPPSYLAPGPCCYGVLPVCPVNCVPNGYFLSSPSCTQCQGCTNTYNESHTRHGACNPKEINETDNLIREIYKYVAQNQNLRKSESSEDNQWRIFRETNTKKVSSKSVGKSPFPSRHDAGVCTLPPKSYSKSCEALGARAPRDQRSGASHSDTLLETSALDATLRSTSIYDTTTTNEVSGPDKGKKNKLVGVLQSFGLLKKNKKTRKDVIEEESETESSTKVNEKAKQKGPFRQDLTNYMMYTQELYHPPPSPPPRRDRPPSPPYGYGYPPYDCQMNDKYDPYRECMRAQASASLYSSMRPEASAPPYPCAWHYDPHCSHNMQPQVPLCLKEVEVKSTGTQSDRGRPFFRKFSQRKPVQPGSSPQPSRDDHPKTYGTQTAPGKPRLFKWKDLEQKVAGLEPFTFSYTDQQKLAQGDNKIRSAMMKKFFYKRNPFSPRNLLVRTLMGTNRSSWNMPPAGGVQRPRLFL